jgi:hypothetical protein
MKDTLGSQVRNSRDLVYKEKRTKGALDLSFRRRLHRPESYRDASTPGRTVALDA